MSKIYLLTFGDGVKGIDHYYKQAAQRLAKQGHKTRWFSDVFIYDAQLIKKQNSQWYEKHSEFMNGNRRGFGYWIWKFQIIYLTLKKIEDNSILIYLDCGYEINIGGEKTFRNLIDLASEHNIFAWHLTDLMSSWTKNDLFEYLNIENNSLIVNSQMIQAGLQIIKKTPITSDLYRNISELCTSRNYHFIDDTPSKSPNKESFVEHRHDQSIFSCLLRIYGIGNFLKIDDYHPELWEKNLYRTDMPFQCFRNISGVPKLPT
jgi:hypothetical protein